MMNTDELYMLRCLELAQMAQGDTSPNPLVGAVLVSDGRIVGEGYHHRAGEPHAEVMAIRSVSDAAILKRCTLYVSLEPCSHYGKTPPCAELIIRSGIPRVVMAIRDPFPQVSGRGEQMLLEAGIEVRVGVLAEEARRLNAPFLSAVEKHRPYITLKWAQSRDGFMDKKRTSSQESPIQFSTPSRMREVHRLRRMHSAILVGEQTALLDNPSLTNRFGGGGQNPIRIVIDRNGTLPRHLNLFDGSVPTIVVGEYPMTTPCSGVEFISLDFTKPILLPLMAELNKRGIQSLLVEGGSNTLQYFIDAGLYDAVNIEIGTADLIDGVPAPKITLSIGRKE